ncbi:MAG: NAD-dependent epimerase/dehydratase family protein, partial [Candidatus Omnitrophica bacterium]|nr:NAD-dependent epimerase/dehydratase family protein [Candidatus Omnitrophota bacterium]
MANKKHKTVLITGGAGFIGSHLCGLFISKNYKVTCLDNFITGKEKNIKHLLCNPLFRYKKIDVIDNFKINEKIDFVLHFASP